MLRGVENTHQSQITANWFITKQSSLNEEGYLSCLRGTQPCNEPHPPAIIFEFRLIKHSLQYSQTYILINRERDCSVDKEKRKQIGLKCYSTDGFLIHKYKQRNSQAQAHGQFIVVDRKVQRGKAFAESVTIQNDKKF